jgi:hypothetical protein
MRIPVEPGPSMPPRDWRDLAFGMFLLLAYLSATSAGLALLARAVTAGG